MYKRQDQFGPSTIRYRILNKLENVYDSDGKPSTHMGKQEDPADEAEEIYMSLYLSLIHILHEYY